MNEPRKPGSFVRVNDQLMPNANDEAMAARMHECQPARSARAAKKEEVAHAEK